MLTRWSHSCSSNLVLFTEVHAFLRLETMLWGLTNNVWNVFSTAWLRLPRVTQERVSGLLQLGFQLRIYQIKMPLVAVIPLHI